MMQGFNIIVLTLVIKLELSQGYCLYGDEKQCAFQCHCAVASECGNTTSECTSGCANGPLGHNWRGPGCQLGNIAYKKPAFSNTTKFIFHDPDETFFENAVDGITSYDYYNQLYCCIPYNEEGADWWVDLGALHRIFNVTIYGNNDYELRLHNLKIYVYNTTDDKVLCGFYEPMIYPSVTINCSEPIVGRFVYLKKYGEYKYQVTLCEVVVIGYKIIDCSKCPIGVTCNDITGCEQCHGSYQPDCWSECEDDSYGINCVERCGKCNSNATCIKANGWCPNGCEPEYYGKKCIATECEDGLYGINCDERCGQCKSGTVCDKTNGLCPNGCEPEYYGKKCIATVTYWSIYVLIMVVAAPIVIVIIIDCIIRNKKRNSEVSTDKTSLISLPERRFSSSSLN